MSAQHYEACPSEPPQVEDSHRFRPRLLQIVPDVEYIEEAQPRVIYTAAEGRTLDARTQDLLSAMRAATAREQKARMDQVLFGNRTEI